MAGHRGCNLSTAHCGGVLQFGRLPPPFLLARIAYHVIATSAAARRLFLPDAPAGRKIAALHKERTEEATPCRARLKSTNCCGKRATPGKFRALWLWRLPATR